MNDKGCPICNGPDFLVEDEDFVSLYVNGDELILDPWGQRYTAIPIKYCPFCGRKLGDD